MAYIKHLYWGVIISLICLSSCEKDPLPHVDDMVDNYDSARIELYTPKRLFRMSSFKVDSFSGYAQGMDIYDDRILFQAGTGENLIHIIDLQESKLLGSISFVVPNEGECHMNNLNCGMKLSSSDRFPLIYLSQTNKPRSCFVLKINNDAMSYKLVQTITYNGLEHYLNNSSYDWFIDYSNNYLYSYGHYNGDKNRREIMKFKLPSIDSDVVTLSDNDILDYYVLDNQSIYQGSRIIDDLLYTPVGNGSSNYPGRLLIINPISREVVQDIPISCGEPEAIAKYKTGAIISSGGQDPTYYFIRL